MGNRLSISVVILTYNRKDCVEELLQDLQRISNRVLEIILVDNGSDDGTDDMVASEFPGVTYLRNEVNLGACGRNRGMMEAKGDIIVTLDDDILGLEIPHLETITRSFDEDPLLGAMNFQVTDYITGQVSSWVHHCPATRALESFPTYEITEGAVALRRSALRKTGCYWEGFFIGHEGPDLAFRLMDAGYEVRYDGRVVVRHKHEAQSRLTWRFYYFDTRNQIWLAARRMRFGMGVRYLSIGLPAMAVYSIRDGFFFWWLKGVFDGLTGLPSALRTRQPMNSQTARTANQIDRDRPGFWTQARKRLLQPANRLDG